jgi:hypothetical protein
MGNFSRDIVMNPDPNSKPWRNVHENEWAFGALMQHRVKYEQIMLMREFGQDVIFGFQDDERFVEVKSNAPHEGSVVIWLPEDFIMESPGINSVNVVGHGVWQPGRNLFQIVQKEYELRAAAYTEEVGEEWLDDPFDMVFIRDNLVPIIG